MVKYVVAVLVLKNELPHKIEKWPVDSWLNLLPGIGIRYKCTD